MKKILAFAALLLGFAIPASARGRVWGFCEKGNQQVSTAGILSTSKVQRSFPSCVAYVYSPSGSVTIATIYSDMAGTPKANPLTADVNGYWFFYVDSRVDVKLCSSAACVSTVFAPYTLGDLAPQEGATTLHCETFAGSPDVGIQLNNCIAALSTPNITADARRLSGTINTTVNCNVAAQILLSGAYSGTATPQFNITHTNCSIVGTGYQSTTLTPPAGGTGILQGATQARIDNLAITGGAYGIDAATAGSSTWTNLFFRNQTTAIFRIQGDSGLEYSASNIDAAKNDGLTLADCFRVNRTTAADTGAIHWNNVRCVASGGSIITNAFNFNSTTSTPLPMWLIATTADGVDNGYVATGLSAGLHFVTPWASLRAASAGWPFILDGASEAEIFGGRLTGESTGANGCVRVRNGGSEIRVIATECNNGPFWSIGGGAATSKLQWSNLDLTGTGAALASSVDQLLQQTESDLRAGTVIVTRRAGVGDGDTFTLRDATTGGGSNQIHMRDNQGTLEWLSHAGAGTLSLDQTGKLYIGADGNFYAAIVAANPTIQMSATSSIAFNRAAPEHQLYVGGVIVFGTSAGPHWNTVAGNNDTAGVLTVGGGGTITYNFATAWTSAPVCVASDTNGAPAVVGAVATTTVLTVTGTVGRVVNYLCLGRPN